MLWWARAGAQGGQTARGPSVGLLRERVLQCLSGPPALHLPKLSLCSPPITAAFPTSSGVFTEA